MRPCWPRSRPSRKRRGLEAAPDYAIVGDGPLREALERDAHERGLAGKVHFLGRRPARRVARADGSRAARRSAQLRRGVRSRVLRGDGAGHAGARLPRRGPRGLRARMASTACLCRARRRGPGGGDRARGRRPGRGGGDGRGRPRGRRRALAGARNAVRQKQIYEGVLQRKPAYGRPPAVPKERRQLKNDRFFELAQATPPAVVLQSSLANALGVIRDLGSHGVPVLALDASPKALGFISRYAAGSSAPTRWSTRRRSCAFSESLGARLPQPARRVPHPRRVHLARGPASRPPRPASTASPSATGRP